MIFVRRLISALMGLLFLTCVLACGSMQQAAQRQKGMNDLKQLGLAFHNFHDSKARGPANTEEWLAWARTMSPEAVPLIMETRPGGRFGFYWNVQLSKLPQGASVTILGYEAASPTAQGLVLFADGSVRQLSQAEFDQAPKPPGN